MDYQISETKHYNGTPCYNSIYPPNDGGHAIIKIAGRSKYHHVVVWEKLNGKLPKDHTIHHLCFNKICVNTLHLQCLTWSEHSKIHNTGSNNPRAILSELDVLELRAIKQKLPGLTCKKLAQLLDMSESHMAALLRGDKWKHI